MSVAAALLVSADALAKDAETYGARRYFEGMRDMAAAVFRAVHTVPCDLGHAETMAAAAVALLELDEDERTELLIMSRRSLRNARTETVGKTLRAV